LVLDIEKKNLNFVVGEKLKLRKPELKA